MNMPVKYHFRQGNLIIMFAGLSVLFNAQSLDHWYAKAQERIDTLRIGGINAEMREKSKKLTFGFLPEGTPYRFTLIADGKHNKEFSIRYLVVDKTSEVEVKMLRRGGFVAILKPLQ